MSRSAQIRSGNDSLSAARISACSGLGRATRRSRSLRTVAGQCSAKLIFVIAPRHSCGCSGLITLDVHIHKPRSSRPALAESAHAFQHFVHVFQTSGRDAILSSLSFRHVANRATRRRRHVRWSILPYPSGCARCRGRGFAASPQHQETEGVSRPLHVACEKRRCAVSAVAGPRSVRRVVRRCVAADLARFAGNSTRAK